MSANDSLRLGTAMKILMPPAAVPYTVNHPAISIVIPIVLPILLLVLLPLATLVNSNISDCASDCASSCSFVELDVGNYALPLVPLLVLFLD
jgi:hypothetical protein